MIGIGNGDDMLQLSPAFVSPLLIVDDVSVGYYASRVVESAIFGIYY